MTTPILVPALLPGFDAEQPMRVFMVEIWEGGEMRGYAKVSLAARNASLLVEAHWSKAIEPLVDEILCVLTLERTGTWAVSTPVPASERLAFLASVIGDMAREAAGLEGDETNGTDIPF